MDSTKQTGPTILVIFGGTGDLARNMIFPSLYRLYEEHNLPHSFTIIGSSHRAYGDDDYRNFLHEEVFAGSRYDEPVVDAFLNHVQFTAGDFQDPETYTRAGERIRLLEEDMGMCPNKLFYLSTSPQFYETILTQLSQSGIASACGENEWARILLEKPFGKDTHTAQKLDELLGELFEEKQIFRIDHYLAKEAVRNLVTFRLANTLFEPAWSREHVESVAIRMLERGDASGRGSFYDSVGALRDVGQNHILQMLALVAMDACSSLETEQLRENRARALEALIPPDRSDIETYVTRAQYAGYRDTKGVDPESDTETYFSATAYLDNERWRGVPFQLTSGKALAEDCAEISITFRDERSASFLPDTYDNKGMNVLTFQIKPEEMVNLSVWFGKPGSAKKAVHKTFPFKYAELSGHDADHMDAYEKLLYDCIAGDHTVFPRTDEVMAAWRYITPIIENFDAVSLKSYRPATHGPE